MNTIIEKSRKIRKRKIMRKNLKPRNLDLMKRITLLGSTGSIGKSTLEVVRHLGPEKIQVVALAAHSQIDLLEQQAREFNPRLIAVFEESKAAELKRRLPHIQIVSGAEGIEEAATFSEATMVLCALVGSFGLRSTFAAIQAGKDIALANKESLIAGGSLIMEAVREKGVRLLPVDSEHSALFQCLNGEKRSEVRRLILTASGGPFRLFTEQQLREITVDQALNHPTWKMGPKVTLDSSTLMNKGLEVIEAYWLFGIPLDQIEVVIHPQSLIHSMVEYRDGSIIAQVSAPSMTLPIQYALTYPERLPGILKPFDFVKNGTLQFYPPDFSKFRCLSLAYEAIRKGGSLPCFMNAANEVLVQRFLERKLTWTDIAQKLESLMDGHAVAPVTHLQDIFAVENEARTRALLA
jgi:1-deoxy-D-xylulose-5-phosphate reductoisomerase